MATYSLFTAAYGSNYANLKVRILEAATGIPAIVMASATSGILSSNGNAVLDSSGNLSVYLDNAKTFTVWNNQFQLTPSGISLATEVQRTAAQLAGTPTQADIGLGNGATFFLDTNPAAQYRISLDKTHYVLATSGGSGSGTVTSIAVTPGSARVSVTGSPITSTGSIAIDVVEANVNLANIGGALPAGHITGLAPVATSGVYTDLTAKPILAPVATSGSYTDLTSKPTIPSQYADSNARAAISVTGTGGSYNSSTGVITLAASPVAPKGTISSSQTVSNTQSTGRYKITSSCTITVPAVGGTDGSSQTFLAAFDCEYFLSPGITVTFSPGTSAVLFNGVSSSVTRVQSGTTNTLVALVSDPVTNNNYVITGS